MKARCPSLASLSSLLLIFFVASCYPDTSRSQTDDQKQATLQPIQTPGLIQENEDIPHPIVTEYAKVHKLTFEEAQRRLELQAEFTSLLETIAANEPTFSGSSIQHEPELRFFISFRSSDAEAIARPYLADLEWANLITIQQTQLTFDDLKTMSDQIWNAAHEVGLTFATGIDTQADKVIIYTTDPRAVERLLDSRDDFKQFRPHIEIKKQDADIIQSNVPYPAIAGGATNNQCTAGFILRWQSDNRRLLEAV